MTHRLLADLVLCLHLAFILFAVLGALAALVWRWAPVAHIPAVLWGAFSEVTGGICPLTPIENSLRCAAGQSGYPGGFIEHYLGAIVYPPGLSPALQAWLAIALLGVNLGLYALVFWRHRSRSAARELVA
jgi:hypothetical protein